MKTYFSDWRNWLHVLIGFTVGYCLTIFFGFPNRENFEFDWRLFLTPLAGGILVAGGSLLWELRQDRITPNVSDMRDVATSGVFAYIGGLTALFYNNLITAVILTAISLVVIYNELKK